MRYLLVGALFWIMACGDESNNDQTSKLSEYNWASLETLPTPSLVSLAGGTGLRQSACQEPAAVQLKTLFTSLVARVAEKIPSKDCNGGLIQPEVLFKQAPSAANDPSAFPLEIYNTYENKVVYRQCDGTTRKITKVISYQFGDNDTFRVDTVEATYPTATNRTDKRFLIDNNFTTTGSNAANFTHRYLTTDANNTMTAFEAIGFDLNFDNAGFGSSRLKTVIVPVNSVQETGVEELYYQSIGGRKDFLGSGNNTPQVRYFDANANRIAEGEADESVRNHVPELTLPKDGKDPFFAIDLLDDSEPCEGEPVVIACSGLLTPENADPNENPFTQPTSTQDGCDDV